MNNRVLLISYSFPPAGGVGVQRALALARYLPPAGLSVSVLTARNPITHVRDAALQERIPAEVRVHRTSTLEPPYALRQRVKRLFGQRQAQPETAPVTASPAGPPPPASALRRLSHALLERVVFPDVQDLWVRPSLQ